MPKKASKRECDEKDLPAGIEDAMRNDELAALLRASQSSRRRCDMAQAGLISPTTKETSKTLTMLILYDCIVVIVRESEYIALTER
jgi:hypothetical protein